MRNVLSSYLFAYNVFFADQRLLDVLGVGFCWLCLLPGAQFLGFDLGVPFGGFGPCLSFLVCLLCLFCRPAASWVGMLVVGFYLVCWVLFAGA